MALVGTWVRCIVLFGQLWEANVKGLMYTTLDDANLLKFGLCIYVSMSYVFRMYLNNNVMYHCF